MMSTVRALWRHPVKGFPPEPQTALALAADDYVPQDRLFAVENGPSGFDPANPAHLPKIKFLMLMRHARLAAFGLTWDEAASRLTIRAPDGDSVTADPMTAEGRAVLDAFLARVCAPELAGPPRLLVAPPGYRFTDSRKGFVSILNRASIAAIEGAAGRPVDERRFRGNIVLDGLPAWGEFDLVGKRFRIGSVVFVGLARIDRCAATDVDPDTAQRDIAMVRLLEQTFEHHDCGVYARVVSGGPVALADTLTVLGDVPPAAPNPRALPF